MLSTANLRSNGHLLRALSFAYLALPWPIFLLGWLRWTVAFPLVLLLVLALIVVLLPRGRGSHSGGLPAAQSASRASPWIAAAVVALWAGLSGAGGYGYQNLDWDKHEMLLKDLFQRDWPVRYLFASPDGFHSVPLIYYAAYHLPAAAAGKVVGWEPAHHVLFVWTLGGALLAVHWFGRLTGQPPLAAALLFIGLSGLDIVGFLLFAVEPYTPTTHLEWWAGLHTFQFTSNTTALYWVPQHALAAWLGTALVLDAHRRSAPAALLLVAGLASLWSPFVALGLVPLCLCAFATTSIDAGAGDGGVASQLRAWASLANVAGLVLGSLAAAMMLSHAQRFPSGWVFDFVDPASGIPKLLAFYALEFGLYVAPCFLLLRGRRSGGPFASDGSDRWEAGPRSALVPGATAVIVLLLCPLFHLGRFSDFTMRASLPSLFVLWVLVGRALAARARAAAKALLVGLVLLGMPTALAEIGRSLERFSFGAPDLRRVRSIPSDVFGRQYLGMEDSFFFRHLAPPSTVVAVQAERFVEMRGEVQGETSPAGEHVVHLSPRGGAAALRYAVELPAPIDRPTAMLRCFAERRGSVTMRIDGKELLRFDFGPTGGRFGQALSSGAPPALAPGTHEVVLESAGTAVRIDSFALFDRALVGGAAAVAVSHQRRF